MSASWYDIRNITDKTAEVAIYDEIGLFGVTAQAFTDSIKGLGNRRLTLRIHSPGGEIFEGSAIYNALRRHKGGVDVAIDGLAASMASVIAMAGEKRSMAENAMIMIHNPWSGTAGDAKELRKTADLLDDLKEIAISAYAGRTKLSREKLGEMMDEETWMTADEAKKLGFVTDVTEPLSMKNSAKRFDISKFCNTPKSLMDSIPTPEKLPVPENLVESPEELDLAEMIADFAEATDEVEVKVQALATENTALNAKVVALTSENAELKASLVEVKESLKRIEGLAGVAPAQVVVPAPKQPEIKSLIDQYNALEGEAQTAFYKKNRAELFPHIKA